MKLKFLLLLMAFVATTTTIQAQNTTAQTESNGLEERVTELERQNSVRAWLDDHIKISGYLQGGFSWDDINGSSFYLRRARVSLFGNIWQDKFDYRLQVDMAGSPKICDLYVRYKPLAGINAQIGQFKLPFSLENELYGPTTFEFIEYSYLTTYLVRNNGAFDGIAATGRDLGLQLYGSFLERDGYSIINYNIGVFNGAGINNKDNNKSKDFIARLIVKPIKGLSLSASYMFAETNYDGQQYMRSPRWSVGAIYDVRHWIARSEYAQVNYGDNRTDAFYALFGYHFEQPWTIAARYEFINDEFRTLDEQRITLGTAYKPFKYLRLQFNVSYTMNELAPDAHRNSLGANLMVSAIF